MAQDNKMDEIKISLDTAGNESQIAVVRVDGVIDTMTSSELEKVMNKLMEQSRFNIIIDLGGVDYISSAGWGIFISNIREIRQNSGDLKLARMIPNVYEIYELLEFDSILQAFENIEKAKGDFNLISMPEDNPGPETAVGETTQVDELDSTPIQSASGRTPATETVPETSGIGGGQLSEEDRVLNLAQDDPFLSIGEMKKILNSEAVDSGKIGWWRIRKILKANDILSKKKRFRFARKK